MIMSSEAQTRATSRRLDRHTLGGLLAILLWSTTVALARSLSEQLGHYRGAAAVYLIAGGLCLASQYWAPKGAEHAPLARLRSLPKAYLLVCGTLFVTYTLALFVAIAHAQSREQVPEIGLLNYLWCPLTLLFSIPILGKRAGPLIIPGTLCALAGLFFVLTEGGSLTWATLREHMAANPQAYGLALLAALTWALYSNLTAKLAGDQDGGGVALFLPLTGLILLGASMLATEAGAWSLRAGLEAVALGAATAASYHLWDGAMRRGDVVLAAAASYLTPLLSTLVICAYLAVLPGISLWIGCLFLIAGSLMSWRAIAAPARAQRG